VCNQEVFDGCNAHKATLIAKAAEKGLLHYAITERVGLFDSYLIDSGLLILSRYPIVETDFIIFPQSVGR